MNKTKVVVVGYGNVGRAVIDSIDNHKDMELAAIATRRDPKLLKTNANVPIISFNELEYYKGIMDIAILCGGSRRLTLTRPNSSTSITIC